MSSIFSRKVVIVGAGDVGASFAYALLISGCAQTIVLIDARKEQASGQALDLSHGLPFVPTAKVYAGSTADYTDASVIVITAGTKQKPSETRIDLLKRNTIILQSILNDIISSKSEAIVVIATNPVDILTSAALSYTQWPTARVLGSGTVLDSARFKHLLSLHCGVDARSVHAYILGEHGDSEVAAWSMSTIAGMTIDDFCPTCRKCGDWKATRLLIETEVRNSAHHIIDAKGSTCYAIGLALVRIVEAILRNEHSVLTVSTHLSGEYGLSDVCLSVPCIISAVGVEKIIEAKLVHNEILALHDSATVLKRSIIEINNT